MDKEDIRWFHSFDFPELQTNGADLSALKLKFIEMPEDLKGKSVLDIGAWDGYFSFTAEKRGAYVVAVDTTSWQNKDFGSWRDGTMKEGFNYARKLLNSKVEDKEIEIMDLSDTNVGKFDLVLCLGIMYHMEEPWTLIKVLKHLVNQGGELILETWTDGNYLGIPAMIFYPKKEINNDDSTFWGPNIYCIESMLVKEGFEVTNIKYSSSRVVFHAKKL